MATDSGWRSKLLPALKLCVAAGALAYLIGTGKLDLTQVRAGLSRPAPLLIGAALLFGTVLLSFLRYRVLILGVGLDLTLRECVRFGFIGTFFNTFLLGSLGGDVIRIHYIMRRTGEPAGTLASVLLDRVLGLLGLMTLAGVTLYLNWEEVVRTPSLHSVSLATFALLGSAAVAGFLSLIALTRGRRTAFLVWAAGVALMAGQFLLHTATRKVALLGDASPAALLRGRAALVGGVVALVGLVCVLVVPSFLPGRKLARLARKVPLGSAVMAFVEAVLQYRNAFRILFACLLLAVLVQGSCILGLYFFSQALPLDPDPGLVQVVFAAPPALLVNALPISFGGLGMGEAGMEQMLRMTRVGGEPVTGGANVFLLWRFWMVAYGLIGLPLYLLQRRRAGEAELSTESLREEQEELATALREQAEESSIPGEAHAPGERRKETER
jgi:uncharacterized membrane protein YbhN (UPF0104 family)